MPTLKQIQEDDAQREEDLACLQRIKQKIKDEGFTGGPLLKAVNDQIEYVKNGGML